MFGRTRTLPAPAPASRVEVDAPGPVALVEAPVEVEVEVVVEAPVEVEVPPVTLTDDEVTAWRSAVRHAGHGAMVPADVRGPLVVALARRSDLSTLALLARHTPERHGLTRAEPGSALDRLQHRATGGVVRLDPMTGREVGATGRGSHPGATSGTRIYDPVSRTEREA